MVGLLWAITVILVLAWLLGFAVNLGAWVHILLVIALLALIFNLLTGALGRRMY